MLGFLKRKKDPLDSLAKVSYSVNHWTPENGILFGSPPCTSHSIAGRGRDRTVITWNWPLRKDFPKQPKSILHIPDSDRTISVRWNGRRTEITS